jgi:multicomponent Na+:H+ antiporter subunit E
MQQLRVISLTCALAVLWLLLSGHFSDPLLLGLGLASVLLVVALAWRLDVVDEEGHPIHRLRRVLGYWPWLLKEVVLANWDVAKAILGRAGTIRPQLVTLPASQADELGRVIYANSITLTPGTVTLDLDGRSLTVHGLTRTAVDGLGSGDMDRRVTALER